MTMDEAERLLALPRTVGADPIDGELISAQMVIWSVHQQGKESRSLDSEDDIFTVTLEIALANSPNHGSTENVVPPNRHSRIRVDPMVAGRGVQGWQVRGVRHRW